MAAQSNNSHRITHPDAMGYLVRPAGDLICRWVIIGALLFGAFSSVRAEPPLFFPAKIARIALDPGHGGKDTGARGPTGQLEKDVCLELARKLALKLESIYQVTLTRSDDYQVELSQRAAIANQADADILISLHTGAGFVHSARGMAIYYHANTNRRNPSDDLRPSGEPRDPSQWEQTQTPHQPASLMLASTLKKSLDQLDRESPGCSVRAAPLAVLEGADMPAVLIETGHISRPATEAKLADPQYQENLANEIFKGVQAFFAKQASSGGR